MKNNFTCVLMFLSIVLSAQDYPRQQYNPERLADELFPLQDMDLNYAELYENLVQTLSNPLDLNKATAEELRGLFLLSENQISELINYRKENEAFLSVYELQSLPSLDMNTIYQLMPFVEVKDESTQINRQLLKRILREENNYFITRYERTLETRKGYLPETDSASRYAGSPNKFYSRFRISHPGDFSLGFTLEKDAGETFSFDPRIKKYGFDYHSFHAQIINKGRIQNLIIGDYQAQFGQGLTLGGGFGMGKGSETITTLRRSNLGFLPYASLNEFGFFRGSALSYQLAPSLLFHAFGSRLYRDGKISIDHSEEESLFTSSLMSTGFHRTPAELQARKQIAETNYGAVIQYKNHSVDAGLIVHRSQFSVPLYRNPTLYNQFAFNGQENTNAGVFLNYTFHNVTFFSEATQSMGYGKAIVAGVLGSLTRQLDVSLLVRKYDRDFYSFYSNALSESTLPQNESGIYWGWKYTFSKRYSLAGYIDFFRFPWLRYRGYAPSEGSEWLLRFNYQPSKAVHIFVQAREENKIRNLNTATIAYQTGIGTKRNYCVNFDYAVSPALSFKTRAQVSTYTLTSTTKGFSLIQDVSFDWGKKVSLSARYALFDTDDYDNRQYAYERDVWLAYSFPAYYGTGIRNYILLQYKFSKKLNLWLRWGHTSYAHTESIGSGTDMINGNTLNDIKAQVSVRL